MELKKTPLYEDHIALGGKMVDFGGWSLPVQYSGIIEEHVNTRENASLFDISHMGELLLEGKDAFDLLQYVCTNDLELLKPEFAQYSPMCYENGTVIDDIFYYMYSKEKYRLIVNASNKQKDLAWLQKHATKFSDIEITDLSTSRARIALQGPKAQDVLDTIIDFSLDELNRFQFVECSILDIDCFIGRTGYTGEDGFEISFDANYASKIWNAILKNGEKYGILPAGLGARDTLRLEACYSLYGNEFSEEITPIEAGVEFVIKPMKQADYIGKKILLEQLTGWVDWKIIAIEGLEKGIFRHNQKVFDESGEKKIGFITSGTYSPTFQKSIALARINSHYKKIGAIVNVKIRKKLVRAKIVNRPFYVYRPRQ